MSKITKHRVFVGILGFFLAFGLGVAVAVYVGRAPIGGSAKSKAFQALWSTATAGTATDMTCAPTVDGAGKLTLLVDNAYPGGECLINGSVSITAGSGADGKVVGVELTLPTNWTATLTQGCSGVVPRFGNGSPLPVTLKVAMGANATPGEQSTFAATNGLKIAPAGSAAPVEC